MSLSTECSNDRWLERHTIALAKTVGRPHDPRFGVVFERGDGARLWDVAGREYFDLTCGYSANNFGHAFAPIVAAAQSALQRIGHLTGDPHPDKIRLAEQLLELCGYQPPPGPLSATGETGVGRVPGKVIFNATGARAIETAWKAASCYRPGQLLVLAPGFHGRSLATSLISATKRVGPELRASLYQVEPAENYPYCARCPAGLAWPSCELACGTQLFRYIEQRSSGISAVLVEPALGARGYIFPPAAFFRQLRTLTQQTGVLMIADEIQTALGRCGDWLLSHQQGWQSDVTVLGKSLGGGLFPISAVVGRAEILDSIPPGAESETFSGTPLACTVALQVLSELRHGPWMQRGREIGKILRDWFIQHPRRHKLGIQRVEGVGASCALEFASSPLRQTTPIRPSPPQVSAEVATMQFAQALFDAGLVVQLTGPEPTRIVFLPPLTIDDSVLSQILKRLEIAIEKCLAFP